MAAGLARRLDHRLGRDARRPPAGAVRRTLHRAALCPRPPHRRQLAVRLLRGRDTLATTCSAASDARPWRSPGSCSASSLSGSRAMGRARRWSSPSTTRPPSGTGRTSRCWQASQPHSGTGRVSVPHGHLLDSGPLGHGCPRPGTPGADQCRLWISALITRGVEVVVPAISDCVVRRELTRINACGSLRRLDDLVPLGGLSYQPISVGPWHTLASSGPTAASVASQALRLTV